MHHAFDEAILTDEHHRLGIPAPDPYPRYADAYAKADWVVAYSRFAAATLADAGLPPHKILINPLGVDLRNFPMRNQAQSSSTFTILTTGTVTPRKGHVYLLDALADVRVDYSLLLRGNMDPVMEPILNRYSGAFRLVPPVSIAELSRYYQQADVFVLPSLSESFGLATLEAMSSGLPVIVSENSASFVKDGYDGFVVPIRDPRAIRQRLVQLRDDPELRRRMGRNARGTAELFTWDATRARHGVIMTAAAVANRSGYWPGSEAWEAVSRFKFTSGVLGRRDRPNDS